MIVSDIVTTRFLVNENWDRFVYFKQLVTILQQKLLLPVLCNAKFSSTIINIRALVFWTFAEYQKQFEIFLKSYLLFEQVSSPLISYPSYSLSYFPQFPSLSPDVEEKCNFQFNIQGKLQDVKIIIQIILESLVLKTYWLPWDLGKFPHPQPGKQSLTHSHPPRFVSIYPYFPSWVGVCCKENSNHWGLREVLQNAM